MSQIDRRTFFHRLGLGVLAAGPLGTLMPTAAFGATSTTTFGSNAADDVGPVSGGDGAEPGDEVPASVRALLAPLEPGSKLAGAVLDAIRARDGFVSLEMTTSGGAPFRLEICARDLLPGAPRPVTRTSRFDLFVANGGKGDVRTERAHGLAAYALAETLSANEGNVPLALRTLRARI